MKTIAIVGVSGKLGQYMLSHALARGYNVNGVCRPESAHKLDAVIAANPGRITLFPGRTDDTETIAKAVAGCQGVLTVLVPWGVEDYASGTARAVLEQAEPGARLIFSCGWHITRDGKDVYPLSLKLMIPVFTWLARAMRFADIDDQVRATDLVFQSDRDWTVVRGSDLEEGDSEGLPIWREHVGDPALKSNIVRRTDYALFMVAALEDPGLIGKAPAIVSRASKSALAAAEAPSSAQARNA